MKKLCGKFNYEFDVVPVNYAALRVLYARLAKLEMMWSYSKDAGLKEKIDRIKKLIRIQKPIGRYTLWSANSAFEVFSRSTEFQPRIILLLNYKYIQGIQLERSFARTIRPTTTKRDGFGSHHSLYGGTYIEPGAIQKVATYVAQKQVKTDKIPATKDNYVGIEIECFGVLTRDQLERELIKRKMHRWGRTITDRTIMPDDEGLLAIEMNFMFKEGEVDEKLPQIGELLSIFGAKANNSCGFHVHLDARNRDVETMYHNLLMFQDVMFKLHPSRDGVKFCQRVNGTTFAESPITEHWAGISSSAYTKHRTIEIRMHEGTVDTERMRHWIKMLLKIVNHKFWIDPPAHKAAFDLTDVPTITDAEIKFLRAA